MNLLVIAGVDISHWRLVDLARLADQARPFYDWVEKTFQQTLSANTPLETILLSAAMPDLNRAIAACYRNQANPDVPFLFDGIGRTYPHAKACYYFFSWLIRDAPQQRLAPLIQRIARNSAESRSEIEITVLAALIVEYRHNVKTFSWEVIREVIIDRLEGSRRSIKGHEKEAIVRTALIVAVQEYYQRHQNYGSFSGIEMLDSQVTLSGESYDVSVNLLDAQGSIVRRILIPIKTRETEGGGHSHLFTRDITSAINLVKQTNPDDYVAVVIVARNWSRREAETLAALVDCLVLFDQSPGEFTAFDSDTQISLNRFIAQVFDGTLTPKGRIG